jgi:hypothetical protein
MNTVFIALIVLVFVVALFPALYVGWLIAYYYIDMALLKRRCGGDPQRIQHALQERAAKEAEEDRFDQEARWEEIRWRYNELKAQDR